MASSTFNPIPLLRTRLDLLRTLRQLSAEQLDLILQEKTDEAGCVVDVKDAVVLRLEMWQKTNGHLLEDWNRIEADLESDALQTCRELRQATDRELAEFQKNETESRTRLQQQRDRVTAELSSLARGAETLSAYENSTSSSSRLAFDVNQ